MESNYEYKGKLTIGIGEHYTCILKVHGKRSNVDFQEIEEEELNMCDHEELKDLESGLYEIEVDYSAWEDLYPESYHSEGDSEFKIVKVKKLSFN